MLRTELELLSGKLIQGDLTPVVYSLIKDSPFLDDIFLYSSIQREDTADVNEEKVSGHANNDSNSRPAFAVWLSDEVQSISIPRNEIDAQREVRRPSKRSKPRSDYPRKR